MSEQELPIRFADTAQAALDAAKSAGQLLREAREAKGLHVAALAVSLKVPVKKLELLEADRLEELPDAVFVRALASSVCRALKIPAQPILEKLPQLNTKVLDASVKDVNVAFRKRADGPAPAWYTNINMPVALGVLALLLAAVVIMMLPNFAALTASQSAAAPQGNANGANAASNGNASAGVSMGSGVNVAAIPASSATLATSSQATQESMTLPTLSVTPALSTPTVSSPTLTVSAISPDAQAALPADSVVVFAASGESWVQVKDTNGKIILERTLRSGERAGIGPSGGRLPYSVIVGRANETKVMVRDQAFDLAAVSSKDAVARFQVK